MAVLGGIDSGHKDFILFKSRELDSSPTPVRLELTPFQRKNDVTNNVICLKMMSFVLHHVAVLGGIDSRH